MLLLAGGVGCADRPPRVVVLLVVDTLRADRLSCYGYERHRTPHLDALAERGARFERAHAAASWTIPSMGSILTSRYPSQLGLVEKPESEAQEEEREGLATWRWTREQISNDLPVSATTVAEHLTENEFRCAAFVNQPGLTTGAGFHQGFEHWYFPTADGAIGRLDPGQAFEAQEWGSYLSAAHETDRRLVDSFASWLEQHRTEDTFAWVHLLAPHRPYEPPDDFPAYASTARGANASDRYDAEIRATDEVVGQLVAHLDRIVGPGRAHVVMTSDHGEALGEHGMFEHGHTLHQEVLRVPLMISGPDVPQAVVGGFVRTIDIAPTILELSGVEESPDLMLGESLVAQFEGVPVDPSSPLFSEGMLYGETERALQRDGFKLMHDELAGRFSLYDVRRDFNELRDVGAAHPERLHSLREELESLHEELQRDLAEVEVTPENERSVRALRALGYVD